MDHKRSPNYPAVGLGDALELAKVLWAKEKRAAMSSEVAAKAWGYQGLNGLVRVKLSALKKFGLLDGRGDSGVRLTDLAVHLIQYPAGSSEYQQALRDAALKPDLFREVHESHVDASDDNLKAYLVTKKGFGDNGAQQFIKAFRETLAIAKLDQQAYSDPMPLTQTAELPISYAFEKQGPDGNAQSGILSLTVPYGGQGGQLTVQVRVVGERLKRSHIAKVRRYLEIAEEDLESGSE